MLTVWDVKPTFESAAGTGPRLIYARNSCGCNCTGTLPPPPRIATDPNRPNLAYGELELDALERLLNV